jgi:hypothetical protein
LLIFLSLYPPFFCPPCVHSIPFPRLSQTGENLILVPQNPFLLDVERKNIAAALKTTEDILRENLYAMAALIASLRGRTVLSYSSYDIVDERPSFPSSLMLQAYRLVEGNPRLDYTELQKPLPVPSGFLPDRMEAVFDELDWWLRKLNSDGTFSDGLDVVRACFPDLGRGIEALEVRNTLKLSPYEGMVDLVPEFDREALKDFLNELLDIIKSGHFICGVNVMCDYCDFLPICGEDAKDRAKVKRPENPDEFGIFDRLKAYD